MWGQSDPKMTRSAPMRATTSFTSSSQNGLTQTCLRNVSTGSSENHPGSFLDADRSLRNRSGRNSEPFSTDARRRLGNRSKSLSKTSDARKS